MKTLKGNLYLIPCTLGETSPLEVLPLLVKKAVENIDYYIVEHEKSARRFIKAVASKKSAKQSTHRRNKQVYKAPGHTPNAGALP